MAAGPHPCSNAGHANAHECGVGPGEKDHGPLPLWSYQSITLIVFLQGLDLLRMLYVITKPCPPVAALKCVVLLDLAPLLPRSNCVVLLDPRR